MESLNTLVTVAHKRPQKEGKGGKVRTIKSKRKTIYHVGDLVRFWPWSGSPRPIERGVVTKVRYRFGEREHRVKFEDGSERWLESRRLGLDYARTYSWY